MITVPSPSVVFNDCRAPSAFSMDITEKVDRATSMAEPVRRIVFRSENVQDQKIKNLILMGHGLPGHLAIGAGLNLLTLDPFRGVRGKVEKIWFAGCLVARIVGPHTASHGDGAALAAFGINQGDGHTFVSAFASLTGCYVVAPTEMQSNTTPASRVYPRGRIPSYEGLVLCYNPRGSISWQRRYPSLFAFDIQARTAQTPNGE